jgi:hypothetical protein
MKNESQTTVDIGSEVIGTGTANVNLLVDDKTLDPISGFAPFKSQLCQVSKSETV